MEWRNKLFVYMVSLKGSWNENVTCFKNVEAICRFELFYFLSFCEGILLDVFVENDISIIFNKLACGVWAIQGSDQGCFVLHVVGTENFPDAFRGLLGVVKRHLREQVVAHVCIRDVVESVIQDRSERSVDSAQSAWSGILVSSSMLRLWSFWCVGSFVLSIHRCLPRSHDHSAPLKWGMKTSVCCRYVMRTKW